MDEETSIKKVAEVLSRGSRFFVKSARQFDKCADHIVHLIGDAYTLFLKGSFSTSVFLSVSVIEEVAKTHMGLFISSTADRTKADPLRNHKTKEIIGSNYTIKIDDRLQKAMEESELDWIFSKAYSGKIKDLREQAVYCDCKNGNIVDPQERIDKRKARNLLLFAIESFEDNLVGYTEHTIELSKETDIVFQELSETDQ